MNKIKHIVLIQVFFAVIFIVNTSFYLDKLSSCDIKNPKGKTINAKNLSNKGKPFLICFWKTCCNPPMNLLDAISQNYDVCFEEVGIKLYAVAIDDSRISNEVISFENVRAWDFDTLLDENSEFKRAMEVILKPHVFLIESKREIFLQKSGYYIGDVELIYNQILSLNN